MNSIMVKTSSSLFFIGMLFLNIVSHEVLGWTDELDPEIEALLDTTIIELQAPLAVQTTCFPTESILSALTPQNSPTDNPPVINVINILREDVYIKTTGPVTRRSLLDEPALRPSPIFNTCWNFSAEAFYNFSPKVFFTEDSPFIKDYIDLSNQNIVNEVSKTEFVNVDLPGVLGLFSTIKLQQHRAGLMLSFQRQWDNWQISARMPLYYLLENFFLTDDEIKKIENNPFFLNDDAGVGLTPKDEVEKFALKHLVSDKFGVGDMRLSFMAHLHNSPKKNLWFGIQATLPTSKTFTRSLIGGQFNPHAPIPSLNLQHFFNVKLCNTQFQTLADNVIRTELTDFLVDVLDRLSTIVINAPLGNGKHFGFGPQLDFTYCYNDYFSTHTYAALEGYMPHKETRFFLIQKKESDFNRNWRDPLTAGENLALINRLIVQTLFPVAVRTNVFPGLKFQLNQSFSYRSPHWALKLGFDYWLQRRESLSALLPVVPSNLPLNQQKTLRPAAQQGKLFASVGYYGRFYNCIDWHFLLDVDGTLFHRGIGENFTIGLHLGIDF